jgi:hypothetical protein
VSIPTSLEHDATDVGSTVQTSVSGAVLVAAHRVYLPLITTTPPASVAMEAVDLVADVQLTPDQTSFAAGDPVTIKVTVTNQGTTTTKSGFWVDLYLNPDPVPDENNMPLAWNETCTLELCQGVTWQVTELLGAGEQIVLTTTATSMDTDYSRWGGWFAAGTTDLYVYVDSWGTAGTNGAVVETNERNNRVEMRGLQVTGTNPIRLSGEDAPLPPRP